MTKKSASFNGMAFYHPEGLVPAWKTAAAFAGEHGRVATLPDIINARIANGNKPGKPAWRRYFTATSAEYLGLSAGGNRIIIVAHGIGPMSTLDGMVKAYSHQFKDKSRSRKGGRISQQEFLMLESGHYGEVSIIDFAELLKRNENALYDTMRASDALAEPLVRARLGARAEDYINAHKALAHRWYKEGEVAGLNAHYQEDPFILEIRAAGSGCSYQYDNLDQGKAIAHLLSMGQLQPSGHSENRRPYRSLLSDVSCHDWTDSTRLAAARNGDPMTDIHSGLEPLDALLEKHYELLMKPVAVPPAESSMSVLTQIGERWFTQHPKVGANMDIGEPEFLVTKIEPVAGGPSTFTTAEDFFFRYGVKEIERIAPRGANAYALSRFGQGGDGLIASIDFFRVEVDTSRRLPRMAEIFSDFDSLMKVLEKDGAKAV